jgi:hypothetical protein
MALHSQKLRGYNGISKYSLNKPMLVFKSRSHTQTETLFEGTIGAGKITITPWQSKIIDLPKGSYSIEFRYDRLQTPHGIIEGPITIPLIQDFQKN